MRILRAILDWILQILPFTMLGITCISAYLSGKDIYLSIFPYLPDSIGYSIATGLMAIKIYWKPYYCLPTRLAVAGLILMNVVSLSTKNTEHYNTQHDIWITAIVVAVSIFLYLLKKTGR